MREKKYYRAMFQARSLKLPSEKEILEAFKSKFPYSKPKPKGNLNIVTIYHHYNWENESLKPALEKFGTVRHYDWAEKLNHRQKNWHKSLKSEMNRDLIRQIENWADEAPIDVVYSYLSGENITVDTARKLRSLGIPTVNMFLNDKEAFVGKIYRGQAMGTRDICRYFDLSWTSTQDALEKYCVEDASPIYLPEGANPDIHRPYELERMIDISFVGQCYGNRPMVINRLKSKGFHIEAFGHGWPNGPLSTEEMVKTYARSKINLGFGGVDGYNQTYCLKGRDFEIPMSGGLYLTEYQPELESCYKVGEEIVVYRGFDDLVKKIRYLLSNPGEADRIRKKGMKRCRNEHTWEMRFEKIFRLMGVIE